MAMLKNSVRSVRKTVGSELMRIEGVYMYLITNECNVGVFLGHKCLRICTWECPRDENPIRAYLIVNKWVYPLARSFSPIHINDSNAIIMPEPFSKFERPIFVAIKLPVTMKFAQKKKLENYLDVFGHLKGYFKYINEIIPGSDEYRKQVAVFDTYGCNRTWSLIDLTLEDVDTLEDIWYSKPPEWFAVYSKKDCRLFNKRNLNLLRLYVTGPKDENHIHISDVPAGIKLNHILYGAIGYSYKRLKLRRKFLEYRGEVPNFDQRLLQHEEYFQRKLSLYDNSVDPCDNIIKAGKILDLKIKYLDFELLDYELREEALPRMFVNLEFEGALITRKVYTQYQPVRFEFCSMQTISQIDVDRETHTVLIPRVGEYCDHHKPMEILLKKAKAKIFGTRTDK